MPLTPPWPLETERLLLRRYEDGDFDCLFAMYSDADVARYLYHDPRTEDEVRDLLRRKIDGFELRAEDDWMSAAVALRDTGETVGDVAFHWVSDEHKTGEIGFTFAPSHQRRGYATEAARAVLRVAFDDFGLHRVI